jgi:Domain of unknown function (DUF4126)
MFSSIIPQIPSGTELSAILLVVSFSAGLNVYATVGMLGILARVGALALPPSLHPVTNPYVIAACAILFLAEFVADKIPIFDLLWNALQTFVRVPVAAALAYGATAQLPQGEQLLATLLGALIAFAAHGGKVAARAAVTHSPEPFSNIALSMTEDVAVIFLTWLATRHPYASAAIVLVLLLVIVLTVRWVLQALRQLFTRPNKTLHAHAAR